VAHHIPSFLGQFAFFFCMTMSSIFFLALRFQFWLLLLHIAFHQHLLFVVVVMNEMGGIVEANLLHCQGFFFIVITRFLLILSLLFVFYITITMFLDAN
jgi:hypothetical protein